MPKVRFELEGEFVELNQLLKLVGLCDSGGIGKQIVASGAVSVDGRQELRNQRMRMDHFPANPVHGSLDPQPRFDADEQKIEAIGKAVDDRFPAPVRLGLDIETGQQQAEQTRATD